MAGSVANVPFSRTILSLSGGSHEGLAVLVMPSRPRPRPFSSGCPRLLGTVAHSGASTNTAVKLESGVQGPVAGAGARSPGPFRDLLKRMPW